MKFIIASHIANKFKNAIVNMHYNIDEEVEEVEESYEKNYGFVMSVNAVQQVLSELSEYDEEFFDDNPILLEFTQQMMIFLSHIDDNDEFEDSQDWFSEELVNDIEDSFGALEFPE